MRVFKDFDLQHNWVGRLMFTRAARKLKSIIAKLEKTMVISGEGVEELSNIHEEYLENTPIVN